MSTRDIPNNAANPRFVVKNTVILFQQWHTPNDYAFPPNEIITGCENNTIVWAGNATLAEFQSSFEIPAACAGQITITDDLSVWQDAVADWHVRHPNVGKAYKPDTMGDIRIPRWDPQPWPY